MACINMLNQEHHSSSQVPMNSPRISFSNDFGINDPPLPPPSSSAARASSSSSSADPTFEFSSSGLGTRPMMAADELFFKGRMLPLRSSDGGSNMRLTTLKEELRSSSPSPSSEYDSSRPPKGGSSSSFFKFMGLKKTHCGNGAKKNELAP